MSTLQIVVAMAVALWLGVFLGVLAVCLAAARGDRAYVPSSTNRSGRH